MHIDAGVDQSTRFAEIIFPLEGENAIIYLCLQGLRAIPCRQLIGDNHGKREFPVNLITGATPSINPSTLTPGVISSSRAKEGE